MLVLTRKYQEKIRIGENITITVLRTKGKAVRLGIEAPDNVPVIRGELSFDVEEVGEDGVSTAAAPETVSIKASPAVSRGHATGAAGTHWATPSQQDQDAKVGFGRVPREQVAGLLPKLVSGNAPLRAMLNQRSSV
jgi:carbon storage regulator